jgi:LysM repeat protein
LSAVAPGQRPAVRGFSAPRVTISMPALIAVMMILLLAGAGLVYAAFTGMLPTAERNTPTPTATNTLPPTVTPTPTPTETPVPTPTPLPPLDYSIKDGDTCISIALIAKISVNSLLAANPTLNCDFLTVGTTIKVPQPTPTPTPLPTATLPPSVATQPTRPTHTVKSGETLAGIARFYGLNVADIMAVNGITDPNNIREGQILVIPIDLRVTPGPTPTATPPPPWAAPNLLGPADGSSFKAEDTITLQWTSVGELRAGEFYYITLEDVTCGCAKIEQFATLETKLIAPETLRPADAVSHLFRWSVTTVRQRNFGETGNPIYDSAGAASPNRYFIWNSP